MYFALLSKRNKTELTKVFAAQSKIKNSTIISVCSFCPFKCLPKDLFLYMYLCLSVCMPVFLSVWLSVFLSVSLSVCLSFCLCFSDLSACQVSAACLFVCLSVYLSVSVCLPACCYACVSVCLPVCCLPICLFVCLSLIVCRVDLPVNSCDSYSLFKSREGMQLLGLGILACLHILVHLKTFLIETEDFRNTGMHRKVSRAYVFRLLILRATSISRADQAFKIC